MKTITITYEFRGATHKWTGSFSDETRLADFLRRLKANNELTIINIE